MLNPSFEPDIDRLSALYRFGSPDALTDPLVQAVTDKIANGFGGMTVQAVLVDDHRLVTIAASGPCLAERGKPQSLAAAAIEQTTPLIVGDLAADGRFAHVPSVVQSPHLRAYAGVALRTPDNHAIGVLSVVDPRARVFVQGHTDLLERGAARIMERLDQRRRDGLDGATGALRREAFLSHIDAFASVANRHRFPVTLIAVDLQALRALLQSFRADLGGLVIDRMSGLGRRNVRRLDTFGRLGDNTFAMLLPNTDEAGARVLGQRIIQGLADHATTGRDMVPGMAPAGIGIAVLRPGLDGAADLIDRAVRDSRRAWLADIQRAVETPQVA